jgi:mannose-6-phosphate isomerase-like protein (cupin superfamily)
MIRRNGTYGIDERFEMRGGKGTVRIEHLWKADEMKGNTRLFAKLILEPGASIGFHEHGGEEEIFVILKGKGRIQDGDETQELGVGDTILTGDGAGHAVESIGDEPLEMMAVIVQY